VKAADAPDADLEAVAILAELRRHVVRKKGNRGPMERLRLTHRVELLHKAMKEESLENRSI
jgi:hypothetical protein